jgi:Arc/MetJ-type ribon-helix-helix transcriptional regulator
LTEKEQKDNYATVRLPKEFVMKIDKLIGQQGFTSRAEIVKEAVRELLNKQEESHDFKMLNHDDRGVKIWDNKLGKNGASTHVQITPKGIYCTACDASKCEHVRFALRQSDIIEIVKEKLKQGWKIELSEDN